MDLGHCGLFERIAACYGSAKNCREETFVFGKGLFEWEL